MNLSKQILKLFKKKKHNIYLTEETLWLYWTDEDGTDEKDGTSVSGYWKGKIITDFTYPKDIWPEGTQFRKDIYYDDDDIKTSGMLHLDIRITKWPATEEWEDILKKTLMHIYKFGAVLTWASRDFVSSSDFYVPEKSSRYKESQEKPISKEHWVYAAYSKEFGFKCTAYLGQPYKGFTDEDMLKLKTLIE